MNKQIGHVPRITSLDGIRGLAVLSVLLNHYTTGYEFYFSRHPGILFRFPWGRYGVECFFIISGFVIALTLERTTTLAEFLWARAVRLYPAFVTCLLLTSAVATLTGLTPFRPSGRQLLLNFTMMPLAFSTSPVDPSYWSLAFELVFYCIVSIFWFVLGLRRLDWFCLVWMAIVSYLRGFDPGHFSQAMQIATCLPWANFFALGVLNSEFSRGRVSVPGVAALILALHLTYISFNWNFLPLQNATYLEMNIVFAFLALAAGTIPPGAFRGTGDWGQLLRGRPVALKTAAMSLMQATGFITALLSARPLVFIGTISYSLYLVHQVVGYAVIRYLEQAGFRGTSSVAMAALVALALATVITFAVEIPLRRRLARRHFQRSATPSPAS